MSFTVGSLFDGSGGFPLAGTLCGGTPVWASEIEPYPIAVTRERFPKMKHLGSVTDINGAEIEPVDVITFGSPCQDLSVAGKRAGIKHEVNGDEETTRSGLFMEAIRIIKEMREATNGKYPTFALWENVPGAFSSNKGEDFRVVLEELIKIVEPTAVMPSVPKTGWAYADCYCGDRWSLAYRVLDAQFWGVPQRRRRIYLVLDLRGERAGEILFKREGLRGYFETGRTPWERAAETTAGGAGDTDTDTDELGVAFGFDNYNSAITGEKASILGVNCGMSTGRNGVITPYLLKIRSGCEGGGKGALVQTDLSATLATNDDQYLFRPIVDSHILDDQGGQQITVRTDGKSPTLRAEMHGNVPCVLNSIGFCPEQSAKTRSIGSEKEKCPTLRAGVTPGVVICFEPGIAKRDGSENRFVMNKSTTLRANMGDNQPAIAYSIENHPADSRVNVDESGKVQTLTSRMGTDGGNVPMVLEQKPVVCYGISSYASNAMLSDNPHSGIYEATTSRTLDLNGGNPACNQGGICVVEEHDIYTANKASFFTKVDVNVAGTLVATDYKDPQLVAYEEPIVLDRAFFNQGQNALYDPQFYNNGTVPTLVARGPSAVAVRYIVRRLTPTECARLQGFPDTWGHIPQREDFTEEEYRFWLEVRNTHAAINEKAVKEYTKQQMLTWYNKLWTDSAEYKMWGNGIALPTALYVMQGIANTFN